MTLLTPNFADRVKSNGAGRAPHIVPAHEPTREGEQVSLTTVSHPAIGSMTVGPAPTLGPLKIALIGTAPSSRMLAPYNDPSWTIWGCSPGNMNALPRVDVWFELHSNLLWPEHESYGRPYIEWLKTAKFPVYMQDQSLVPNATSFPMIDLVAEFGRYFFTSSFAWMMALAIKMGAAEIALYGIDMASRDEYILQRPGFSFFKNEAERRGIKVSAPHESDIMQPAPLYAYVDSTPIGRKIRARKVEVQGRVSQLDQQLQQATQNKTYLQGALEDIDYFDSIWSGSMDEIILLRSENAELKGRIAALLSTPIKPVDVPMTFTSPAKPRRKRRTKAEMQAAKAAAEQPLQESLDG